MTSVPGPTARFTSTEGHRVLSAGKIKLLVKDPTGVIRARVIQHAEAASDQRVDVWGFLEVSPTEAFLNNAYFEVSPPAQNDGLATSLGNSPRAGASRAPLTKGLGQFLNYAARSPRKEIFPCACTE